MFRPATRAVHLRRLTALGLGASTALILTACQGSDGSADNTPRTTATQSSSPRGLLTKEAARQAVDTYVKINNRANATRNPGLLNTVEDGQVYEQSSADFEQWDTMTDKDQKWYKSPFYYEDREYLIPAADSGASWFAVKTYSSADTKKRDILLILDKVDGTYKVVMSLYTDQRMPKIAVDENGFISPAAPSTKVGSLAPSRLSATYEDFFETGGKRIAGKTFAPTESSKGSIKVYKSGPSDEVKDYAREKFFAKPPAHPKVYALKLADGGTLAFFPTAHNSELMLEPQWMSSFDLTPGDDEAVYNDAKRDIVVDEFQGQALAVLNPKSKPRVIGIEYRLVDSR
ncbi:hypothetical protein ACWEFD_33590 [Streptomyces ardesiacus]